KSFGRDTDEAEAGEPRAQSGMRGATCPVRAGSHEHGGRRLRDDGLSVVLAGLAQTLVGGADGAPGQAFPGGSHRRPQMEAQPSGPAVGFVSWTVSPGLDRETAFCVADSQRKRSRKRRPLRFTGWRTQICLSTSMLAPATPTAKKERLFAPSACLT